MKVLKIVLLSLSVICFGLALVYEWTASQTTIIGGVKVETAWMGFAFFALMCLLLLGVGFISVRTYQKDQLCECDKLIVASEVSIVNRLIQVIKSKQIGEMQSFRDHAEYETFDSHEAFEAGWIAVIRQLNNIINKQRNKS